MPEMPEVETIARQLRRRVAGKLIAEVRLSGLPLRKPVAPGLGSVLCGRTIRHVRRYGKYLVLTLDPKAFWVIHLGMSGRVLYHERGEAEAAKHTHASIRFADGSGLEYRDPRRFGLLAVHEGPTPRAIPEIGRLGKDPLGPGLTGEWLGRMLRGSRREVKPFLLDQAILAGLGNIYACEALFVARIHPERGCPTLTDGESFLLADAVQRVLRDAIRRRGTTFSDFRGADGKAGGHQNFLAVYMREGKPCIECGRPVRRIIQGNRSTFFCQQCQR